MWSFSEGRLPMLVALVVLPFAWDRLDGAFGKRKPDRSLRAGVGLGVAVAVGVAFMPGILLPLGLMAAAFVLLGRRRDRGIGLALLAAVAGGALAFPVLADVVADPGATLSSFVGTTDVWSILRLAPDGAPGTWVISAFLPIAAAIGFASVGTEHRGRSWRALVVALAATGLAWGSAAGHLPDAFTNAPAYLAVAALAEAALVAYGLASIASGLERHAFGARQIGVALMTLVLSVGIGAQALQAVLAEWEVRPGGLPPAWPVIDASAPGDFRILWLGEPNGQRFPAPGGDPLGVLEAGGASVRFGVTDRRGTTALDTGRAAFGPGYDSLERAMAELLSGDTSHAGALLAPFGVRFVVSDESDLPAASAERLDAQVDMDLVPAGGLTIYRVAGALPTAFVSVDAAGEAVPTTDDPEALQSRPADDVVRVDPTEHGWAGVAEQPAEVVVASQFDEGWRLVSGGERVVPARAYGWAISGPVPAGPFEVEYQEQRARTVEMWVLAVLWLAALWITRKPVSS